MLEKLAGKRYTTLEALKKDIEKAAKRKVVTIIESETEKPEDTDFMIDYTFDDDDDVYTMFYLKDNGGHYYITEV